MSSIEKEKQRRCAYCGRFFKADRRVGDRQKSCRRRECQAKGKKEGQRKWLESNPGYFKGRYEETKAWRKLNPLYQRQWRAKKREIQEEIPPGSPIRTIRIVIPEKWLQGEIKDEIRLVRQCGCGFFVTGGGMQDKRADSAT